MDSERENELLASWADYVQTYDAFPGSEWLTENDVTFSESSEFMGLLPGVIRAYLDMRKNLFGDGK